MDEGEIEVDSILPIGMADITPDLARRSGFNGVVDLLKTAKHGSGENVYLVRFHYLSPTSSPGAPGRARRPAMPASPIERLHPTLCRAIRLGRHLPGPPSGLDRRGRSAA
jgi:hypothetical protein